jgi:hypothetical protein
MDVYRVIHDDDHNGWCVSNEGNESPIECFKDKNEAIEFGMSLAQDSIFGRLTVEAPMGIIEAMWSYGADPVG